MFNQTKKRNTNGKPEVKPVGSRKMAMESMEARQLMAADVMQIADAVEPIQSESIAAEVAPSEVADNAVTQAGRESTNSFNRDRFRLAISNGFLKSKSNICDMGDLANKIDVWEHAYAIGSSGLDGVNVANIGSSGLDGVDIHSNDRGSHIGSSGQDGITADLVDTIFNQTVDDSDDLARSSSLPDSMLGVMRWENLMEYFQVLDRLAEIAKEFNFDFSFDTDGSLARARADSGLLDTDVLSAAEAIGVVDRVIADVETTLDSDSSSESSSSDSNLPEKYKELLQEALLEMKKRMVIYWQTAEGPGHVVYDPFGVAGDDVVR